MFLTLSVFLPSCENARRLRASILSLQGVATVQHSEVEAPHPVSATTLLAGGDKIELQPGSRSAISLIPGIFLESEGEAAFVIEKLGFRKDGNAMEDAVRSRSAGIRLERGRLRVLLPPTARRAEVRIESKAGIVVAYRKSLFSIDVTAGDSVRMICASGLLEWTDKASGQQTKIPAGFWLDAGRINAGEVSRTELDPAAEQESKAIYDAASYLESAIRQRRDNPVTWR